MSTTSGPTDRQVLGAYGEALAARHLIEAGMVLLDRNWRCPAGEIDLVLRDGRTLVFAEVKTRSSTAFGTPLEAVGPAKAGRLRRLAAAWMEVHQLRVSEVRLDLVGVLHGRDGVVEVQHVKGIC